jgi:hypothetical protein
LNQSIGNLISVMAPLTSVKACVLSGPVLPLSFTDPALKPVITVDAEAVLPPANMAWSSDLTAVSLGWSARPASPQPLNIWQRLAPAFPPATTTLLNARSITRHPSLCQSNGSQIDLFLLETHP